MPCTVQERPRARLRRRSLDHERAVDEYATLYALRIARNLSGLSSSAANRVSLGLLLLPLLGIEDPEPEQIAPKAVNRLLATIDEPTPRRIGAAFDNLDYLTGVLRLNDIEVAVLELAIIVSNHAGLSEA